MRLEEVCVVGLFCFVVMVILPCVIEHHGFCAVRVYHAFCTGLASLVFGLVGSTLSFTLLFADRAATCGPSHTISILHHMFFSSCLRFISWAFLVLATDFYFLFLL